MISPVCFSKEWHCAQANALQARDVRNLEKCVLALELVGRLKKAGLEFIFKGGTSLLLLTDQPRRLSIDVDILCLESQAKLEEVLDRVVGALSAGSIRNIETSRHRQPDISGWSTNRPSTGRPDRRSNWM
ncbi:MAG: nucleotidyl transferase AbiEii/AbiGii toxin family protein [Spartobacteria bacterium]